MKKNNIINIEPERKTISFWELLKLKIANQNNNVSKILTLISISLSLFCTVLLNCNFMQIGLHSQILAKQNSNFWIILILMIPFLFLSASSFVFCFLSNFRKTEFLGMLSFYLCIFNLIVLVFFIIFISAVF